MIMNILSIFSVFLTVRNFVFCEEPVFHRFEYEFKVLEKLIEYGGSIKSLNTQLEGMKFQIFAVWVRFQPLSFLVI